MNKYMKIAKENAIKGIEKGEGGPFGAVIVDKLGNIIASGNNKVILNNDPTAHAEIVAIREACRKLNKYDLSEYILYTSAEPCPMCLSAIIWANIKKVYYGCNRKDAEKIGFRDNYIYEYLNGKSTTVLDLENIDREECMEVFEDYIQKNGVIY